MKNKFILCSFCPFNLGPLWRLLSLNSLQLISQLLAFQLLFRALLATEVLCSWE